MARTSSGPVAPVGGHATRGATWTILFSSLNKGVTLASQIVLAWFLYPRDFGLVALTLSLVSFASLLGSPNLRSYLVQRPVRLDQEAGQVFWFALALNSSTALLLIFCSPLFGVLLAQPQIVPLIVLGTISAPLQALNTIYAASLHCHLQFRRLALINFTAGLLQSGSAVLLAWLGFGPYALILPLSILAAYLALAYRMSAGPFRLGRPQPRQWGAIFSPVRWLMLNSLFLAVQTCGAPFIIGLVHKDPVVIGFFFWGACLATQAIFLLTTNLQSVFFPVLSRLNADPARQFTAVRLAARTLVAVLVPVCLMQAFLVGPLVRLLFGERWVPAIPVVQWLSVGLITQPLAMLTASALLARGQFQRLAGITATLSLFHVCATGLGALIGDQATISLFVCAGIISGNFLAGSLLFGVYGSGWMTLLRTVAPPMALGLPTALAAWFAANQLASLGPVPLVLGTSLAGFSVYALSVWLLLPDVWKNVMTRLFNHPPVPPLPNPLSLELK